MRGTGEYGAMRVGYQVAGEFRNWVLTRPRDVLGPPPVIIQGVVSKVNTLWITQTPLDLGLWLSNEWWIWPNVRIDHRTFKPGSKFEVTIDGHDCHFLSHFVPSLKQGA